MSIFIIVLIVIVIYCAIKIFLLRKSIKEIRFNLNRILVSNTNNLISISSTDRELINLTNDLNVELEKLREERLQYENGNQELKHSITNISHDLRTPLTAISCYVDLLKEEILTKKQGRYINIINDKTNELVNLTEQLFDYSKSLDLEKKNNKKSYCINEILEETVGSYYNIFKKKDIIPNIKICEKKIYKNIDKTKVIRIFENLISNCIRYSDNGCNIELKESGKVVFSNKASKLDSMTVKKIFDRYYTIENIDKNSGVGLSIAKQLVELNGGNIVAKYLKDVLYIEIELE
ncbi:MAG: HAMP domain-containing sensor histidine kinase [Clostridia bacterium]|nr:HAMP domain-containing sensor histidine kinase [Clostridia bacterium]